MRSKISMDALSEELARITDSSTITPLPAAEISALEEVINAPQPREFRSFPLRLGPGARPGPALDLEWIIDEKRRTAPAPDPADRRCQGPSPCRGY
ncbi:hypothetical protein [Streptosporangium subroseum]|uniref:hypothetical protein n=1 Tax=Streptosporangium subroseum TaxID=106412 RepID=UPI003085D6A4|nr:hypothetical protein OHB15_14380 [Streptosporangium subroseum]